MEQAGPSGGYNEAKAIPVGEPIKNLCSVVSSKNPNFVPLSHPDSTKWIAPTWPGELFTPPPNPPPLKITTVRAFLF